MQKFKLTRLEYLFFLCIPKILLKKTYKYFNYFDFIEETRDTQTPITFEMWYTQVVGRINYGPYWPVHSTSIVLGWKNVYCGIETSPGYSSGNFISSYLGEIYIGDYTQIAPNVGLIAENHELTDSRKFVAKKIVIGKYCWIGMGAVVLPGVELGDYTIVAAGAIVTKSFVDGYQVIGGNPAKVLKVLNPQECVLHTSASQYNGFIPHKDFEDFRKKYLNI
jgi:acetyltransferase-like isoleucine patch superfamily enzyme